jgi:hypothetical protein
VPDMILAASVSDNAPAGAIFTFAFPVLLFAAIAVVLYLLFSRPHRRVPDKRVLFAASTGALPEPEAAHGAAVAAGLPIASGAGSTESVAEAPGARREHADAAEREAAEREESDEAEREAVEGDEAERDAAAPAGAGPADQPGNGGQGGTGNVSDDTQTRGTEDSE